MEELEVVKISPHKRVEALDPVSEEIPLTIYVNEEELVTLLASPENLTELAIGFIFTSGLIKDYSDIDGVIPDTKRRTVHIDLKDKEIDPGLISKRAFTSGCGRGALFYNTMDVAYKRRARPDITIDSSNILAMMKDFQLRSPEFRKTGGVHSAALADSANIITIIEDLGRHNAVDKIIGYALKNGIDLNHKIILSSGRLSSEIVLKVQKTQISAIISRSAPTDQAVKHAILAGITLIGFARGQRMNVYSCKERVV
ncbi:MAG: formate dehydrogenase accessory sulfurtransferase FdhD [Candidatus Omnitrophota bacterium]